MLYGGTIILCILNPQQAEAVVVRQVVVAARDSNDFINYQDLYSASSSSIHVEAYSTSEIKSIGQLIPYLLWYDYWVILS